MIKISNCWKSGKVCLHCNFATALSAGARLRAAAKFAAADGQATLEYAVVAGVLVAMVIIISLFLTTFSDYDKRVLDIIASDYP